MLFGKGCVFNVDDLVCIYFFFAVQLYEIHTQHTLIISYFITATQMARLPLTSIVL